MCDSGCRVPGSVKIKEVEEDGSCQGWGERPEVFPGCGTLGSVLEMEGSDKCTTK